MKRERTSFVIMSTYERFEEIPSIQSINMSLLGKIRAVFSDYKECLLELQECGSNFRHIIASVWFCLGVQHGVSWPKSSHTCYIIYIFSFY